MAGVLSQLPLNDSNAGQDGNALSVLPETYVDQWRRQSWESGNIDYKGRDSFDNIWNHIIRTLNNNKPTHDAINE